MFGVFPFGVPYFAQPQVGIILVVTTNSNTRVPVLVRKPQETPRLLAQRNNDKPVIKH